MIQIRKLLFAVLLLAVCFGCSYHENFTYEVKYTPSIPNPMTDTTLLVSSGNMNGSVNGASWNSIFVTSTISENSISITGIYGNTRMTIEMNGFIEDTYYILVKGQSSYTIDSLVYTGITGEIQLISVDHVNKTLSGTFEFSSDDTGNGTKTVTNGVFTNVGYYGTLPESTEYLTALIDNSPWSANNITGTISASNIYITGISSNNSQISFVLPDTIATGTYNLASGTQFQCSYYDGLYIYNSTGTLNVTTHDIVSQNIAGVFNFTAIDSTGTVIRTISNGSFAVEY